MFMKSCLTRIISTVSQENLISTSVRDIFWYTCQIVILYLLNCVVVEVVVGGCGGSVGFPVVVEGCGNESFISVLEDGCWDELGRVALDGSGALVVGRSLFLLILYFFLFFLFFLVLFFLLLFCCISGHH